MTRPARRVPGASTRIGVNLVSMIDVVFLLLIYFMVATDFRPREKVFRLDLPERRASAYDPLYDATEEPLVIVVEDRATTPEYTLTLMGGWGRVADAAHLRDWLAQRRVGGGSDPGEGLFTPRHPIVILAPPTTRWRNVVEVFNAVVRAGYDAVSLDIRS